MTSLGVVLTDDILRLLLYWMEFKEFTYLLVSFLLAYFYFCYSSREK